MVEMSTYAHLKIDQDPPEAHDFLSQIQGFSEEEKSDSDKLGAMI